MVEKPSTSDRYYKWKGSWKVRGEGGDVIECMFKDTPTYSRVTGNTKDEMPVCNMTDKGAEGNRCYCSVYIYIYIYIYIYEMWCWRRVEKISWTDHVRNEECYLELMSREISYMK
jgi:hypothetical protein